MTSGGVLLGGKPLWVPLGEMTTIHSSTSGSYASVDTCPEREVILHFSIGASRGMSPRGEAFELSADAANTLADELRAFADLVRVRSVLTS